MMHLLAAEHIDWFAIFDRYGFPMMLVGMLLLVVMPTLWLAGLGVVRWLRPYLERFFEAHITMCNSLSVNNDKQTEMLDQQKQTLEKLDVSLEQGHNMTHRKIDDVHEDVKYLKKAAKETWYGHPPASSTGN